jgi:hypothetical protein
MPLVLMVVQAVAEWDKIVLWVALVQRGKETLVVVVVILLMVKLVAVVAVQVPQVPKVSNTVLVVVTAERV